MALIGVSGVGPKVGLKIVSDLPLPQFMEAILSKNTSRLTQISGVGKKMAERLITELKDKLPASGATPASSRALAWADACEGDELAGAGGAGVEVGLIHACNCFAHPTRA